MSTEENNITKLCSFYVSDWHLVTMLLPYVNQKINEQAKIATILEKDIKENITTLLKKLNLKNAEKILKLNWSKAEELKIKINELEKGQELIVFINGSKEFIESQNKKIGKYFQTHLIKHSIKIVNCYEVINLDGNIEKILNEHDKVLNTSGEKEITEVFKCNSSNELEHKAVVGLE